MKDNKTFEKYKWNLSLVLSDKTQFDKIKGEIEQNLPVLKSYKGKLNSVDAVVKFFKIRQSTSKMLDRIYLYAFLRKSQDNTDAEALKLFGQARDIYYNVSEALSFVAPELSALPLSKIEEFEADKRLLDYDRSFYFLKRDKPHILSVVEETLLSGIGTFADFDATFDALDNVEIKFESVKMPDGKKAELTNTTYNFLSKHDNRSVRKQAYINLHKGFSKYNLTLSQNYINQLKYSAYMAKSYKHESTFDSKLFGEEIDKIIYDNLIESVNQNLPMFYEYADTKRKLLGLDKMHIYDFATTPFKDSKFSLSYEGALDLVKKALLPLGGEYIGLVDRANSEGWIDVFPSKGKETGAFSISTGTGNPFILLNYQQTYGEISTMAHELGHAMHSFYSEQSQPYPKQDYVIFVAEVASTVNELLLNRYILKTAKSKDLKKFIIDNTLQKIYTTIFRQTMFSEFEYNIHSMVKNQESIAFDVLNKTYGDLQKKYFGKDVEIPKYAEFEWSRIPHFYRPFYVYKYATGLICAIAISEKLASNQPGYRDKYKSFLSGGSSTDPVSLLKLADIDISDKSTYDNAFKYYSDLILEYKKF